MQSQVQKQQIEIAQELSFAGATSDREASSSSAAIVSAGGADRAAAATLSLIHI